MFFFLFVVFVYKRKKHWRPSSYNTFPHVIIYAKRVINMKKCLILLIPFLLTGCSSTSESIEENIDKPLYKYSIEGNQATLI